MLKADGRLSPLVFLSYSHSDQPLARAFADALAGEGIETWLNVDQIKPGDSITLGIDEGIASADAFVFLLSAHSIGKDWTRHELSAAMARRLRDPDNVRIIPVLVDDVKVPALLRDTLYLDFETPRHYEGGKGARPYGPQLAPGLWVPKTSSTSRDQAIFVDQPPTRACLRTRYCSRSTGSGSGFSGAAASSDR